VFWPLETSHLEAGTKTSNFYFVEDLAAKVQGPESAETEIVVAGRACLSALRAAQTLSYGMTLRWMKLIFYPFAQRIV
jgi:hypothetical protein